jgi:hypothetical protein
MLPETATEIATKSTALLGGAEVRKYPQVTRVPSARKAIHGEPPSTAALPAIATTFVAVAGMAAGI